MSETTNPPEANDPAFVINNADAARIARASFVGTALEWYDYFLFGTAAALVFNHLFFTDLNASAAILASFATFGVGYQAIHPLPRNACVVRDGEQPNIGRIQE